MFLYLLIIVSIGSGLFALVAFILYARSRMREDQQNERRWLTRHYISLMILFLTGIIYMFYMIERGD